MAREEKRALLNKYYSACYKAARNTVNDKHAEKLWRKNLESRVQVRPEEDSTSSIRQIRSDKA